MAGDDRSGIERHGVVPSLHVQVAEDGGAGLVGDVDADIVEAADGLAARCGVGSAARVDRTEIVNAVAPGGGVKVLEEDCRACPRLESARG